MVKAVQEFIKQGMPALLLALGAACLALAFFELIGTPPYLQRLPSLQWPLALVAALLIVISIALWWVDPVRQPPKPDEALNGHNNLIRFLLAFEKYGNYQVPSFFKNDFRADERAAEYAAMYLEVLTLLERNGGEYRISPKGTALLKSERFKAANAPAYV